jgi:hypothetical protein
VSASNHAGNVSLASVERRNGRGLRSGIDARELGGSNVTQLALLVW